MNSSMAASYVKIENRDYVVLPREEYEKLAGLPAGAVDAAAFMKENIAELLRGARAHAKLSQGDLAKKIKKSQAMVSSTEAGKTKPSERYVGLVLKACGLPKDWTGPKAVPTTTLTDDRTGKPVDLSDAVVRHRNGNPLDNSPGNLAVVKVRRNR